MPRWPESYAQHCTYTTRSSSAHAYVDNPLMSESQPPRHSKPKMKAAKTPHLQVRTVEGLLFEEAIAITGNARALLQLRDRIDRALENETSHPFEEAGYRDVNGIEFEVAVKRAKSREEMREPVPKPEKTPERLPWGEKARGAAEDERAGEDEAG